MKLLRHLDLAQLVNPSARYQSASLFELIHSEAGRQIVGHGLLELLPQRKRKLCLALVHERLRRHLQRQPFVADVRWMHFANRLLAILLRKSGTKLHPPSMELRLPATICRIELFLKIAYRPRSLANIAPERSDPENKVLLHSSRSRLWRRIRWDGAASDGASFAAPPSRPVKKRK